MSAVSPRFLAVFRTELLFNMKRAAPYALMTIFSANALLWWGWGPAIERGWAVNSDFYIVRLFDGFSFMTLPLFISLIMADPVVRDFRVGVDPLIFSKPIGRAEYLLGKFLGNFFVLVCCQFCFALTLLVLQAFGRSGMVVLPPRILPYLQHFFFFVVGSSLALAAVFFAVGTLTRNVKLVYGLAVSFYFLYGAWQYAIKGLAPHWRMALDPLMIYFAGTSFYGGRSADWLNEVTISYDAYMIANRVLMVAASLACLAILYLRFSTAERADKNARHNQTSILNLVPRAERLYDEAEGFDLLPGRAKVEGDGEKRAAIGPVNVVTRGLRAGLDQFIAALGVEFRLLRAERSLVVVAPLIALLCGLQLAAFELAPGGSYSATYAGRTADALLIFLFGTAVFYTGETMHRDRESGIEPVLWSTPAPNAVLLLSKFSAALLLSVSLILPAALTAICLQIYKGHAPLDLRIYLMTCAVIIIPGAVFMSAASVALNVLLRDKYLTYAVSLAIGGAYYYLIGRGHTHWLYNILLYESWSPADPIDGGDRLRRILTHRVYSFAISTSLLSLALLFFERKSAKGLWAGRRPSGRGWAVIAAILSMLAAVIAGLMVSAGI